MTKGKERGIIMKDLFIGVYDGKVVNVAISDSDKGNELKYMKFHYEVKELLSAIVKGSPEIQEFDRIFICEDGRIDLYAKGKDY